MDDAPITLDGLIAFFHEKERNAVSWLDSGGLSSSGREHAKTELRYFRATLANLEAQVDDGK